MTTQEQSYYEVGLSANPKDWVFSNSSLSTINPSQGGHPLKMMQFFTERKEETESKALERGSLFHNFMEHPDLFAVSEVVKPSDKLATIADLIIDICNNLSCDFLDLSDDAVVNCIRQVGWNNKWSDEAVLKNVKPAISAYVQEVLNNTGKYILSASEGEILKNCMISVNNNETIIQTIKDVSEEQIEVFKEYSIFWTEGSLKCKAKLDKIEVDHINKVISHYDYKTTSKNISTFEYAFESYRYYRQFAFYDKGIKSLYPDYKIYHFVVVVETTAPFASTVFPVTNFWLNHGFIEIDAILDLIKFHLNENNFTRTRQELLSLGYSSFRDVRQNDFWI
jgi:hypothetical protein